MIKKHKWLLLVTSFVTLLPIVVGLILWDSMPEQVPMHWNIHGEIDDWGSRATIVFVMPLFMLGMQWLCLLATLMDPKSKDYPGKVITLVLWICPILCNFLCLMTYTYALGCKLSVELIMPFVMGLLFVVIGNYLPKCKQNYTIGIKVPWALHDEGNWNKTHRFAGKLWVVSGAVIMATSFLGSFVLFFAVLLPMTIAPVIYSYVYHRQHSKKE